MKNFDLNPGGITGAIVGGAGLAVLLGLAGSTPRLIGKAVIVGVIGGAVAGKVVWQRIQSEKKRTLPDDLNYG